MSTSKYRLKYLLVVALLAMLVCATALVQADARAPFGYQVVRQPAALFLEGRNRPRRDSNGNENENR